MNPYLQSILLLALMVGIFVGGIILLKRDNRIPVIGLNGPYLERRKCRPNKHGGLTWKGRDGRKIHLELDRKFSYKGIKSPEYIADVSPGQGRIIYIKGSGDSIPMPGELLYMRLFGGAHKDIAESSKTDINKTLTLLLIGGGVGLVMILGAVLYAINLLQGQVAPPTPQEVGIA